jgi:hypothetical protein
VANTHRWGVSSAFQSYFQKIHLQREKIAQEYKKRQKEQKQELEMGRPGTRKSRPSSESNDDGATDSESIIPGAH